MEKAAVEQQQAGLRSKLQCLVYLRASVVGCGEWGVVGNMGFGGNRRGHNRGGQVERIRGSATPFPQIAARGCA